MATIKINNLTECNKQEKLDKAFDALWDNAQHENLSLDKVQKAETAARFATRTLQGAPKGEQFVFSLNQELCDRWCNHYTEATMTIYDKVCEMLGLPKIGLGLGEVRKAFEEQEHPRGKNGRFVEKGKKVSVDFGYLSDIDEACIDYLFNSKVTFAVNKTNGDYYYVRRIGINKIALCVETEGGKYGNIVTVKDKNTIDYLGIPVDVKQKNIYNIEKAKNIVIPSIGELQKKFAVVGDELVECLKNTFKKVTKTVDGLDYKAKQSVCVACNIVNNMVGWDFTKNITFCCDAGSKPGGIAYYRDDEKLLSLCPATYLGSETRRAEYEGGENDKLAGRNRITTITDNGLGVISAIIHELGHAIDDFGDKELQNKHYVTFFHSCQKGMCPTIYSGGGKIIPQFATDTFVEEFFAECFANYVLKLNDMTAEQQAMIESRLNTIIKIGG